MKTKQKITKQELHFVSPTLWAMDNHLALQGCEFSITNHEYQKEIIDSSHDHIAVQKAAQLGITEGFVIQDLHHQLYGIYPYGVLYLFPTETDVLDFSKTRFRPLLQRNSILSNGIKDTDSVNVKNIFGSMLFLRGGRSTQKIDGLRETSSRLKSIPVDAVYIDERDEIAKSMVAMAMERMGHSRVKHYREFGTPTVPGYGISLTYQQSDQRIWLVKCQRCGVETCLELTFPDSLGRYMNGKVFRMCRKCKKEIDPSFGRWEPRFPGRDVHGYYSSQLTSKMVDPGTILNSWIDPEKQNPPTSKTEVMNSKLGLPFIESENELTETQVRACFSSQPSESGHEGPCGMGVDVGKHLHVVIGYKVDRKYLKVLRYLVVDSFEEVHELASKYNVQCAVFDKYPETHKVREFIAGESFDGYTCEYPANLQTSAVWDLAENQIKANRTELLDESDKFIRNRWIEFPRENEISDIFISQLISSVKKLERKKVTNTPVYRYIERGDDHFRHSLNYFILSCQRINEYVKGRRYSHLPRMVETSTAYMRI